MNKPIVEFKTDLKMQVQYMCFLAKQIAGGFYPKHGYLVLPYLVPGERSVVYFPRGGFAEGFWERISRVKNSNYGAVFPEACEREVERRLGSFEVNPSESEMVEIITKWREVEDRFFKLGKNFLDFKEQLGGVREIRVLVTRFGSSGSFYSRKTSKGKVIEVTYRLDLPLAGVARSILMALNYIDEPFKNLPEWYQHQKVVDYLFMKTRLGNLFLDYLPVTKKNKVRDKKWLAIVTDSRNYLAELGFPEQSLIEMSEQGQLIIKGKPAGVVLSIQEKAVLEVLLVNRNHLVTYDQLGETMWKADMERKFSLYAIAKVIEGLRNKLKQAGMLKQIIVTVRDQGYVLVS